MFDLLVDASNACRDEHLGGAQVSWTRLDRLLEAWRRQVNPVSRPLLVADDNLARDFRDQMSRDRWASQIRAGTVLAAPDADAVMLGQARETGAAVLSRDAFVAHRRRHSWIQGDSEHFWRWTTTSSGEIEVRLEPMTVSSDYSITRAAEAGERKRLGLGDEQVRAVLLSRLYRCENPACDRCGPALRELPAARNGRAVCPGCLRPLYDRGPRPEARRFKVVDHGEVVGTEDVADGEYVTFGTAAESVTHVDLSVLTDPSRLRKQHLLVEVLGGQAVVMPLGDADVHVQRWQRQAWQPPEMVSERVTLRRRDRVVLPGGVALEQSGLSYVVPQEW